MLRRVQKDGARRHKFATPQTCATGSGISISYSVADFEAISYVRIALPLKCHAAVRRPVACLLSSPASCRPLSRPASPPTPPMLADVFGIR
jgi:hypothetical protein